MRDLQFSLEEKEESHLRDISLLRQYLDDEIESLTEAQLCKFRFIKEEKKMTKQEFFEKIQDNKKRLASMKRKRENLDLEISNLELKIKNQERSLSSFKGNEKDSES